MKSLFFVFLLLGLFHLFSLVINANSCVEHYVPLIARYSRADSVFIGKIQNIKRTETPLEQKEFYEKYRLVKFEIQKIYKGLDVSTKQISLLNVSKSADYETEKLRTGQTWIVFVRKYEGNSYFGGMCDASGELEDKSDFAYYEKDFFSVKDKQAILGRVINDFSEEKLKGVDVILEGNGQKIVTQTDEEGLFYFSVSPGNYKITVIASLFGFYSGYKVGIKKTEIIESSNRDAKPDKTIFSYEVQLKGNRFEYEELPIFIFPSKQ